ncbi:MAG: lipopolysaccharide heptosyltransferase II [Planctomycetota bacterium]|nr:lipopolysaccharide heptosyltransferase II [Planctomycetota bacterium]
MTDGPPQRVLVRLPNWIGDIVMATPALAALRRHWPSAELTVAGPPHAGPLLAGTELHDRLIELPSRRVAGLAGLRGSVEALKAGEHDLAFVFTNSFSSALVVALAGIRSRIGYVGGGRTLLLTHRVFRGREAGYHQMPVPMVEQYFRLLEAANVPRGSPRTVLATTEQEECEAEAWLKKMGLEGIEPLFGIHPGSSFGPSKLWYPEKFAAVADELSARWGGRVIVFCGPSEQGLARSIAVAANCRPVTAADVPLGLGALKAVVRRLKLLVSTDTGPRHLGPAFDVPTVVVMGSTDPRFTNTNLERSLVVRSGVDCSPCQRKVCPIDHRCMTRLEPAHVLAASERLLAGSLKG